MPERWITYLKERFPLPTYGLLVMGMALSGLFVKGGAFAFIPFLVSCVGLFLFFGLLRLMDEYKDYEKDRVVHPDRPLPRGVLGLREVFTVINALLVVMLLFVPQIYLVLQAGAAKVYLCVTVYLWLMYREFFASEWLAARPLLYAISHQLIILPLTIFIVAVSRPEYTLDLSTMAFGLVMLGGFFTYEVCRKLDPEAHPLLRTYRQVYGVTNTCLIVLATSSVGAFGAYYLGYHYLLWPVEGVVVVACCGVSYAKGMPKIVELLASLSLLIHVWAVSIFKLLG